MTNIWALATNLTAKAVYLKYAIHNLKVVATLLPTY